MSKYILFKKDGKLQRHLSSKFKEAPAGSITFDEDKLAEIIDKESQGKEIDLVAGEIIFKDKKPHPPVNNEAVKLDKIGKAFIQITSYAVLNGTGWSYPIVVSSLGDAVKENDTTKGLVDYVIEDLTSSNQEKK